MCQKVYTLKKTPNSKNALSITLRNTGKKLARYNFILEIMQTKTVAYNCLTLNENQIDILTFHVP
jgi:hypothetical protein